MRKINELIFASVCLLGMAVALSSCEGNGTEPEPEVPALTGSTIMVPNEANVTQEISLEMDADWSVSNSNTWFTVQPLSGAAGTNTLTITVADTNPDLTERVSSFRINEGGTPTEYFVIQDVTPGMTIESNSLAVSGDAQDASFVFRSNVDVEVASESDWITIAGVAEDSVLLADNSTYSKYKTYTVNMSVAENSGDVREGNVLVSAANGATETFTVSQMGELVADYSREFLRRSLIVRYTGNWCGYCPAMNLAVHGAIEEYPDHIVAMNMYQGSGELSYPDVNYFMNAFNIQGFPTAIMNYYCEVGNTTAYQQNTERFVNLAKEAVEELPANTVLGGVASVSGNQVVVELSVASKEAGNYYVSAFLLEDGIIGSQSDYTGLVEDTQNYDHSSVMRAGMTAQMGDSYSLSAQGLEKISLSVEIPSNVENPENLHVVVFTTYDGQFTGSLSDSFITYNDYKYVVDNVVDIPVGGFAIFSYE